MNGMQAKWQRVWLLALGVGGVVLAGCFDPFKPNIAPSTGIPDPPPALYGAEGTVRRFQWCWNHRNYDLYRELFSDDFLFVFGLGDSAGNQFREDPVTRTVELDIAKKAFIGGGAEPPATNVVLNFDQTLRATSDDRGRNPRFHQQVLTNVDLSITVDTPYRVTGQALFYLVRADSAKIPDDLSNRDALARDTTRWFIQEWDDLTLGGAGGTALRQAFAAARRHPGSVRIQITRPALGEPPANVTWGYINALYSAPVF